MQPEGHHCAVPPPPPQQPASPLPSCSGIHTLVVVMPVCGPSVFFQSETEWSVLATLRETFIANQGRRVKWQYAAFESGTGTFTIYPARRRERCDDYDLKVSTSAYAACAFLLRFHHPACGHASRCEG